MRSRWHRKRGKSAWMMGVLNCTPDSFSDGNELNVKQLVKKAELMIQQGADIVDVGGESTRPNAKPISLDEELNRVIPVIEILAKEASVSIDSMKAEVMRQAIDAGATLVNDVSALMFDDKSLEVVADTGVDVCLMHMKGEPENMQTKPNYSDVILEVTSFFEQRIQACLDAGIQKEAIILDPGIGFGKRLEDNLSLITHLNAFKKSFGMPMLLGTSRKSFHGQITGSQIDERELETAVTSGIGIFCGADIIRVHDCEAQRKTTMISAHLADYKEVTTC